MSREVPSGPEVLPYGMPPIKSTDEGLNLSRADKATIVLVGALALVAVGTAIAHHRGNTTTQSYEAELANQLRGLHYTDIKIESLMPGKKVGTYDFAGRDMVGNYLNCHGRFLEENGQAVLPQPTGISCQYLSVEGSLVVTQ